MNFGLLYNLLWFRYWWQEQLFSQISFNHSKLNIYDAGTLGGDCNGLDLGFDSSPTPSQPPSVTPGTDGTSGTGGSPPTAGAFRIYIYCLLYTSPSPRD